LLLFRQLYMHKRFHIELIVLFKDVKELHHKQYSKHVLNLNLYSFKKETDDVVECL
jgi:hypothetical protein